MKVFSALAIFELIAIAFAAKDYKCRNAGEKGGITVSPNSEDCRTYYYCINGYPTLRFCRKNYLFDVETMTCQPSNRSQCAEIESTPSASKSKSIPYYKDELNSDFHMRKPCIKCPSPNEEKNIVIIPNTKDCNSYFMCISGLSFLQACVENYLFDIKTISCQPQHISECAKDDCEPAEPESEPEPEPEPEPEHEPEPEPEPQLPSVECPDTSKEPGIVLLPNEEDCKTYYMCINGSPLLQSCSTDYLFDTKTMGCQPSESSQCAKTEPEPEPEPEPVPEKPVVDCSDLNEEHDIILIPNVEDCTTYFTCIHGYPILSYCSPGYLFDTKTMSCQPSESSQCAKTEPEPAPEPEPEPEPAPQPEPELPSVKCPDTSKEPGIVLLPNEKDCKTYYMCINGSPLLQSCSTDYLFDTKTMSCQPSESSQCAKSEPEPEPEPELEPEPEPELEPEQEPEIPFVECPNYDIILIPNDEDCTTYFKCINGNSIMLFCAPGYLFDIKTRTCRLSDEAQCATKEHNKYYNYNYKPNLYVNVI